MALSADSLVHHQHEAYELGGQAAASRPHLADLGPLSGIYADDPTPRSLLRVLGLSESDVTESDEAAICDSFEEGFYAAMGPGL